jgi:hypothetical protein
MFGGGTGNFSIVRWDLSGAVTATYDTTFAVPVANTDIYFPPGSINVVIPASALSAGSITVALKAKLVTTGGGTVIGLNNLRIFACEI